MPRRIAPQRPIREPFADDLGDFPLARKRQAHALPCPLVQLVADVRDRLDVIEGTPRPQIDSSGKNVGTGLAVRGMGSSITPSRSAGISWALAMNITVVHSRASIRSKFIFIIKSIV